MSGIAYMCMCVGISMLPLVLRFSIRCCNCNDSVAFVFRIISTVFHYVVVLNVSIGENQRCIEKPDPRADSNVGVMVSVFASSLAYRRFEPRSGQFRYRE